MILADKIIQLRKKNGWSQEELADKLGVTRQSVSKWESAQSIPDLNKILLLGQIFGVSTDYLLKDEMQEEQYVDGGVESDLISKRHVSMEEANEFLAIKKNTAPRIGLATVLCILSPICLLLLPAASETGRIPISEEQSGAIGLLVLLFFVAIAVYMFIMTGEKTKKYEFLDSEPIETEYGVAGMVREKQSSFRNTYIQNNAIGTCLCVLSIVPLVTVPILVKDDFVAVICVVILLMIVSAAVFLFINVGVVWASMEKLVEEGDYSLEAKVNEKENAKIAPIYWLGVTGIYLLLSFWTMEWHKTWTIWPVAAILFGIVKAVLNMRRKSIR